MVENILYFHNLTSDAKKLEIGSQLLKPLCVIESPIKQHNLDQLNILMKFGNE